MTWSENVRRNIAMIPNTKPRHAAWQQNENFLKMFCKRQPWLRRSLVNIGDNDIFNSSIMTETHCPSSNETEAKRQERRLVLTSEIVPPKKRHVGEGCYHRHTCDRKTQILCVAPYKSILVLSQNVHTVHMFAPQTRVHHRTCQT